MPTTSLPKLDAFTLAYVTAALWSTTDEGGESLDTLYGVEDLSETTLGRMGKDCKDFQDAHAEDIEGELEQAGHDFWLTRNGHSAGFWDGDWDKDVGCRLTEASHAFGEVDLYVGDDGRFYG